MEYTTKMIDEWIEKAGLSEHISIYMSAIEIDWDRIDESAIPEVEGVKGAYDDIGYRVLAQLLKTALEGK